MKLFVFHSCPLSDKNRWTVQLFFSPKSQSSPETWLHSNPHIPTITGQRNWRTNTVPTLFAYNIAKLAQAHRPPLPGCTRSPGILHPEEGRRPPTKALYLCTQENRLPGTKYAMESGFQQLPPNWNICWRDLPEDITTSAQAQGSSWTTEDWPQTKTSMGLQEASNHTIWQACHPNFPACWAADQEISKTN